GGRGALGARVAPWVRLARLVAGAVGARAGIHGARARRNALAQARVGEVDEQAGKRIDAGRAAQDAVDRVRLRRRQLFPPLQQHLPSCCRELSLVSEASLSTSLTRSSSALRNDWTDSSRPSSR